MFCVFLLFVMDVTVCRSCVFFFFQAEDGIRYLVRSRGLGDVYKRQAMFPVVAEGERAICVLQ